MGDTNKAVKDYKAANNLPTLPLGIDNIGLTSNFGVTAFPTTVVIDRYGLIAFKSSGSEPTLEFWTSLFSEFTADDYSQISIYSKRALPLLGATQLKLCLQATDTTTSKT